ncbi:uncharacterized protein LOC118417911 [Branchiostoma floridae]|uniref:Uncharacterized protein LOC118417911 n=1 Tax=Branchiostoma floridae TaxID=7739 RepID=A0A9J7MTS1_BRAFL|nr:uncharacterized protein LOC118417911 [Branchiostoma floridae]
MRYEQSGKFFCSENLVYSVYVRKLYGIPEVTEVNSQLGKRRQLAYPNGRTSTSCSSTGGHRRSCSIWEMTFQEFIWTEDKTSWLEYKEGGGICRYLCNNSYLNKISLKNYGYHHGKHLPCPTQI